MSIRLYNTAARAKQDLVPINPDRLTLYVCGPTVYGRAHIGNFRPAVVFDVLQRLLRLVYGADKLVYARNITDIDDKIMDKARAEGVDIEVITQRYEALYLEDAATLGVERPDLHPHATTSIPAMVAMIAALVAKGNAYAAEGHVLFDVVSHADYGSLSRRPLEEMIAGARVEVAPYKRNPADFVLWKPSTKDQAGWPSPWGRGRPGWHIECSAMIAQSLGQTIDIHGGGIDLTFPHHENECAQSACAHDGAPLANIWMHNGFLNFGGGEKMSKSLGNVQSVGDLTDAGWHGEVIRSALISSHYRQPVDWNEDLLAEMKSKLDGWYEAKRLLINLGNPKPSPEFLDTLSDDLDTPAAMAVLSGHASKAFISRDLADGASNLDDSQHFKRQAWREARYLVGGARLLGLLNETSRAWRTGLRLKSAPVDRPKGLSSTKIKAMLEERSVARKLRNWAESDRIRDLLAGDGIVLEDGPSGTSWRRG